MDESDSRAGQPGGSDAPALGAAFSAVAEVIGRWRSGAELSVPDAPEIPRNALLAMCDALEAVLGTDPVADFRSALSAGDAKALAAAAQVWSAAAEAAQVCLRQTAALFHQRDWQSARELSLAATPLAAVTGTRSDVFDLLYYAAASCYKLNRLTECIDRYSDAIASLAQTPPPDGRLSAAYDNRGLALLESGRVDDALHDFASAGDYVPADDVKGRVSIDNQRAGALLQIAMYRQSIALYLRALATIDDQTDDRRAITTDNLAQAYELAGWRPQAVAAYEQANRLLADHPAHDRYVNAVRRAQSYAASEQPDQAASAFNEAVGFARQTIEGRFPVVRLRAGLADAMATLVPADAPAWQERAAGLVSGVQGDYEESIGHYSRGADLAAAAGDRLTHLLCLAGVAGVMTQAGIDWRQADDLAAYVRAQGEEYGLAGVVAQADAALSALRLDGVDSNSTGGDALYHCLEGLYLADKARELALQLTDPDALERAPLADGALFEARFGRLARESGDLATAIPLLRASVAAAQRSGNEMALAIRLNNVVTALAEADHHDELAAALAELRALADSTSQDAVRLTALTTIGQWHPDRPERIRALEQAIPGIEDLRTRMRVEAAAQPERAVRSIDVTYPVYRNLHDERRAAGDPPIDTFGLLQRSRARDLFATLAGAHEWTPPDADEAVRLLGAMLRPTALLDVAVVDDTVHAYVVDRAGVRLLTIDGDARTLLAPFAGEALERSGQVLALTFDSPILRSLAAQVDALLEPDTGLVVVLDAALSNLPVHAIPLGDGAWGDRRLISRLPGIGALTFSKPRAWTGGAVIAGDSAANLPYAKVECEQIGGLLKVPPLIGADCTLEAVSDALHGGPLDLAHLAVHGRGDALHGGRSALLLAEADGRQRWVNFDELASLDWNAALIVFSGCSTAVAGPRDGSGLYGIAQAVAAAGADRVIASLWPVDDASAAEFMIEFYTRLAEAREAGDWVDLCALMDRARHRVRDGEKARTAAPSGSRDDHLRDGRDFLFDDDIELESLQLRPDVSAALHWAPFVLLGDPILRFT